MIPALAITRDVHLHHGRGRRKVLQEGPGPDPLAESLGRVPRISRLMALAIRLEKLVRAGEVADYADVARLGHVTRARVTQIMNFLCLAPDIQEEILFLPPTGRGRDPIREHHIRPILRILDWRKQRKMWREVNAAAGRLTE